MAKRFNSIRPNGCRLLRAVGLFGLAIGLVLFAAPSTRADYVPGMGIWAHYRYSLDDSLITVRFIHDSGRGEFPVLTIPRSYIYFANGAPPSTVGPLPDPLETNHLGLSFTEPEGEAWSTSVEDYRATHGGSRDSAADALRIRKYTVELSPNTNDHYRDAERSSVARGRKQTEAAYGQVVEYADITSTSTYYVGTSQEEFITAKCHNPVNEVVFCEYTFLVTPTIVAEANFSDFRVHGGLEYANRRVRFARSTVCRFLEEC